MQTGEAQASAVDATDANRVGAELRLARERLGWSIAAIGADLRIRPAYLLALEEGRPDEIPAGNAYAIGFLRTYARGLGLDADILCRRFREEMQHVGKKPQLTFPVPVPDRGVPAGALVLLGTVLAIGAYVGWYRMTGDHTRMAEPVPAVPARLEPLAAQATLPSMPSPQVASMQPGPTTPPLNQAAEAEYVMPPIAPSQAAAMPMPANMVPQLPAAPEAAASPAQPAADDSRILLRVHADTWLQVRDKSGTILLNRTFHNGESWPVPAHQAGLLLTTGNAGGFDVVVDGQAMPALGAPGAVKRDLPLDADGLKSGKIIPASAPASTNRPAGQ